jgi:hypothetical protein
MAIRAKNFFMVAPENQRPRTPEVVLELLSREARREPTSPLVGGRLEALVAQRHHSASMNASTERSACRRTPAGVPILSSEWSGTTHPSRHAA